MFIAETHGCHRDHDGSGLWDSDTNTEDEISFCPGNLSNMRCTMIEPRDNRQFVLVVLALPLMVQGSALGEVSIRLDGVPERLSFPIPEGINQVLTATVRGGEAKSVWLASSTMIPRPTSLVTLTKVDEGEYQVNLAGREVYDLLRPHGADGEFRVCAETADGKIVQSISVRYMMHVMPERLDFPWDEARLTIYQRSSKKLPGSDGALRVHLGDITAEQVLVSIYGPRGELVVDTTPMQEGDTLSLPLVEQDYVLRLDKLVNLLVGHDYGVFSLMPRHQLEANNIDDLLRVIENADVTFIRNDQELSGEAFATHLRGKHEFYGPRNASLSDFIENIATRSSTTGKRYRVKRPSGDIIDADTWLREQAAKLVKEPKEEDDDATERNEQAPSKPGCRLDTEGFERFLDKIEESGVTFTYNGSEVMTAAEFTRFFRPYLGFPYATDNCFDAVIDFHTASREAFGDTFQAKFPDGHTVATASWLREQVNRAVAETGASQDPAQATGAPERRDAPASR